MFVIKDLINTKVASYHFFFKSKQKLLNKRDVKPFSIEFHTPLTKWAPYLYKYLKM